MQCWLKVKRAEIGSVPLKDLGRELAISMPVPCATLDQVQCQILDPVPSGS